MSGKFWVSIMPSSQTIIRLSRLKVFSNEEPVGINPKVNNLNPAFNASSQELVLISDSGIRSESHDFF